MDMDLDIKSGVYRNKKIPDKISNLLKINKTFEKNQLIYISKILPSGHWEIEVQKEIYEKKINVMLKPIKKDVIATSVLSKGIFYIEYSKDCVITIKEDNSKLNIKYK